MKKILSMLLVLSMLVTGLALAACATTDTPDDKKDDEPEATTTTTKRVIDVEPGDDDDTPEDVALIEESVTEWKYHLEAVYYLTEAGVTDYIRMDVDKGGDGFARFVAEHPDWNTLEYDDSDESTWEADVPMFGPSYNNIGYDGDNHGLFLRCEFELTADQIAKIRSGDAELYFYGQYDNTVHMYINGVEVFQDDDSDLYQEGVNGSGVGCSDWHDNGDGVFGFDIDEVNEFEYNQEKGTEYDNVADFLNEGKNVVAISLKDAWGGRLFNMGLYFSIIG